MNYDHDGFPGAMGITNFGIYTTAQEWPCGWRIMHYLAHSEQCIFILGKSLFFVDKYKLKFLLWPFDTCSPHSFCLSGG